MSLATSIRPPSRQRGVALITAVLIVALATITATALTIAANASLHRAAILQETERAWWFSEGVQSWVRAILALDAENSDIDALNEEWAQPIDYLPVEAGFISGRIIDQQGLFNLNNLAVVDDPAAVERYQQQLQRLFESLEGIDPYAAQQIVPAIRDWVDADQEPSDLYGAEDNEYLGLELPYRAANRPMESVSELLLVRGMTPEIYRAIRPYVTVLPEVPTAINVNTAPVPVLRALTVNPTSNIDAFAESRLEKPAEAVSDLIDEGVFGPEDAPNSDLAVSSKYFLLQAETTIGNSRVALLSLYKRVNGAPPILLAQSTDPF